MTTTDALTAREAIEIARDSGLPYRIFKDDIRANLMQARELHGTTGRNTGRTYYARELFTGYCRDIAYECHCASREARDFERRAY